MRRVVRLSVGVGVLLGGLVLVLPGSPAAAIPIFPGNPGTLQVTFDNTGSPWVQHGSCVPWAWVRSEWTPAQGRVPTPAARCSFTPASSTANR